MTRESDDEDVFGVLLIEDNDGDALLIEKYLERVDDDLLPQDPVLRHEKSLSSGFERLRDDDGVDLVLLDLGLPESSGIETLHAVLDEFGDVPVVVLTGLDDRGTAVRAIQEGAQDYLNKDSIDVQGLGRALRYAVERRKRERKSERRKELRRVVQEVLVGSSTQASIERRLCDGIVEQEPYVFACVTGTEADEGSVVRASSDAESPYLEHLRSADASDAGDEAEPSVRAAREREAVFVQDTAEVGEPWADAAARNGFASAAAVPLVYEGVLYGVLSVYSDLPDLFDGVERDVLKGVVDSLSYCINVVGKEKALMSDETTEVKIGLDASASYLTEALETADDNGMRGEAEVLVRGTVPTEDGVLQFVDVEAEGDEDDEDLPSPVGTEPEHLPDGVESAELVHSGGSTDSYQFEVTEPTPESRLLNLGVFVRSTEVTDDGVDVRAEVPPQKDVAEVVDRLESRFGSATVMVCRGTRTGETSGRRLELDTDRLTDKQREALKAAYYRGYFEQPKRNSAGEVAEALGVSRSTFLQHLRTAQRKVLGGLFD